MASLLDFMNTPAGMGLLSAVAGGLAGARRSTPINNVGRGLLAGLEGYSNTQDEILKRQQMEQAQKMQDLQLQQGQLNLSNATKEQARQDALQKAITGGLVPGTPATVQFDKPLSPPMPLDALNVSNVNQMQPQSSLNVNDYPNTPVPAQAPKLFGQPLDPLTASMLPNLKPNELIARLDAIKKANAPISVNKDARLLDPNTHKVIVDSAPTPVDYNKPFLPDGTPNKAYQDYSMANRRAGASSMNNYGTSFTPAIDAKGNAVFLQPSKAGGAPNAVSGYYPTEMANKITAAQNASNQKTASLDNLDKAITDLKNAPGLSDAVGLSGVFPAIPGTEKADAIAQIENLGSRAAIETINEMRAQSKSGGAVGQVSEAEWPKLEAGLANLNRKQSYNQYVKALNKFQAQVRQSKSLIDKALKNEPGIKTDHPGLTPNIQDNSQVIDFGSLK